MQERDENDQGEDGDCPDDPDGDELGLHGFHVEDPESYNEESQVAKQEDQPGCTAAPPGVVPGQGSGRVKQVFHKDAEGSSGDGYECTVGNAQYSSALIREQHLGPNDARYGKHKTYFNVETDE
jgi:hypothetical protein